MKKKQTNKPRNRGEFIIEGIVFLLSSLLYVSRRNNENKFISNELCGFSRRFMRISVLPMCVSVHCSSADVAESICTRYTCKMCLSSTHEFCYFYFCEVRAQSDVSDVVRGAICVFGDNQKSLNGNDAALCATRTTTKKTIENCVRATLK